MPRRNLLRLTDGVHLSRATYDLNKDYLEYIGSSIDSNFLTVLRGSLRGSGDLFDVSAHPGMLYTML